MNQDVIDRAAAALREAAEARTACAPVRELLGTATDLDLAYAVQRHNIELRIAAGARPVGAKIGLTAPVVQAAFGVDRPDFGVLTADMAVVDGAAAPIGHLLQPRAEAEVALVLAGDLDRGRHTVADVLSATAYLLPAIELVDSRVAGWDITIVDTIADNASSGMFVLGSRPVAPGAVDLVELSMRMVVNGETASTGTGAACLGNPLNAAVWLADELCRRGTPLRAGDVVMTGALGAMVSVRPGDSIDADLGPLGRVRVVLSGEDL